jgi:neutral ceramidase
MKAMLTRIILFAFTFSVLSSEWEAGLSSVKITPERPVPLVGYASRTNVFKEVDEDVYAKALALKDSNGGRALLITADICILSPTVAEPICEEIAAKTGLARENIIISVSHTHSGPWVSFKASRALGLGDHITNEVIQYTRSFQKKLVEAGTDALAKLAPAKLSYGLGVANFGMNRRESTTNGVILGVNPRGYVDRAVPVLRIDSPEGELRGVLFGYACHGTTFPSDSLIVSPDYPGYARDEIQKRFPKAEALFIAGLGGSANPYPRTGVDLAKQHGSELGREVCRVLETKLRVINGPLRCEMENAELPLEKLSREQVIEAGKAKRYLRDSADEMIAKLDRGESLLQVHKAPVGVWQFGPDLTLISLSGEVVGEYVPLIERALGPMKLWPAAYCNAVSGYIPTRQTLEEGGYECRGLYEDAGWYTPEAQNILVEKVAELAKRAGRR